MEVIIPSLIVFLVYLIGYLAALLIIIHINDDEARHDALTFIPHSEAMYSWVFVLWAGWIFLKTFINRK